MDIDLLAAKAYAKSELDKIGKVIWTPNPGPQTEFLGCDAFEALFGGAVGGGKTWSLIHDALRDIDKPSYVALLLRNSFPEMEKTLLEESRRIYPKLGAYYVGDKKRWNFPSGAKIYFGYLENDADVYQYQGAEFQYIGFDELTKFSLKQYTYLMSRLRSSRGVRSRIRASTNPGGKGHGWVMARWLPWIDKKHALQAKPGEVLKYTAGPNGDVFGEAGKLSRTFIPAKLTDNPKLLENDPDYVERLGALDPVTRAQLLDGRWDVSAAAGLYFKRSWITFVEAAPQNAVRTRGWDKAATEPSARNPDPDWTRGVRLSFANDRYYIEDLASLRGDPGAVKAFLRATAQLDGKTTMQRIPQDPGAAGKSQAAEDVRSLDGYMVHTQTVSGDKVTRFGPVAGQASPQSTGGQQGRFCIVRAPWNEELIQELEAFPDGDHDDIVDALSDAYDELQGMGIGFSAPPPPIQQFDPDCAPMW